MIKIVTAVMKVDPVNLVKLVILVIKIFRDIKKSVNLVAYYDTLSKGSAK